MPYRAYYLDSEGQLRRPLTEAEIGQAYASRQGLLWVDVFDPRPEDGEFLEKTFAFHHLAVEDCLTTRLHAPKIDDFGEYLFMIVHGVDHTAESDVVETTELAIFLGPTFVVSSHNLPLFSIDSVRSLVEDDGRPMRRGADFLAHALIDALIDNVLPTIDRMEEMAEVVQEEALATPQQRTLGAILRLKRSTLRIHRVMAPQREMMNRLARGEFPIIKEEAFIFYRDIYDHLVRISDLNQIIRDEADSALTTYLSSVGIQQNETMKVLSAVASIFLPLGLIAGVYGMNFRNMPELEQDWAYFVVVGFMAAAMAGAVWWFWRLGWIRFRRGGRTAGNRSSAVDPEAFLPYDQTEPGGEPGP